MLSRAVPGYAPPARPGSPAPPQLPRSFHLQAPRPRRSPLRQQLPSSALLRSSTSSSPLFRSSQPHRCPRSETFDLVSCASAYALLLSLSSAFVRGLYASVRFLLRLPESPGLLPPSASGHGSFASVYSLRPPELSLQLLLSSASAHASCASAYFLRSPKPALHLPLSSPCVLG